MKSTAKEVRAFDDRKLKILSAVVDEYIVTGEPVGSKAIMKYVNTSSATIRNEMAELEKQGYLEQPHTSAGRVPTYNGYRLYVDRLVKTNPLSKEEKAMLDGMILTDDLTEEGLVQSVSAALAELTNCAAVVSTSVPKFSVITKVEVIPTGKRMYVLLLITSSGSIKNKVCRLEFDLSSEQLEFFENFMRENLEGVSIDSLSDEMLKKLESAMGTYLLTLSPFVTGIYELSKEMAQQSVVVEGERNLLTCRDFDQNEIIRFLDNKEELKRILDQSFSGLHVMFSDETDSFVIGNSSIITSPFSKGGKTAGHLGIIGPMRLDYSKIIPYVEYFTQKISDLISDDYEDEEDGFDGK